MNGREHLVASSSDGLAVHAFAHIPHRRAFDPAYYTLTDAASLLLNAIQEQLVRTSSLAPCNEKERARSIR
jgi:hypothetical protein